jgi:hypothetical protein
MSFKPGLQTVIDNTDKLKRSLDILRSTKLMVGIPDENAGRSSGPASNAVIGYVLEHGDASRNLPPRPFLHPGVNKQQDIINDQLKQAGKAALEGNESRIITIFNRLGLVLVNSVRGVIDAQGFIPLAPSTVEQRLAKLGIKAKKQLKKDRLSGAVMDAQIAAGSTNYLKILIDTGALRNSITYVLRRFGRDIG